MAVPWGYWYPILDEAFPASSFQIDPDWTTEWYARVVLTGGMEWDMTRAEFDAAWVPLYTRADIAAALDSVPLAARPVGEWAKGRIDAVAEVRRKLFGTEGADDG